MPTKTRELDRQDDPLWLRTLPDGASLPPPVMTRAQVLPFGDLTWQNFERLCLRISATDGEAEACRLFGTQGQAQGGIDIYVRRRGSADYAVWQSKRRKSFGPIHVKAAVDDFLGGEWADKADRFVLCVQASLGSTQTLRGVEAQTARLSRKGIEFVPMDGERLSLELKSQPEIVDDFFGRPWVEWFCGASAAEALAGRLSREDLLHLRDRLRSCYAVHFSNVDPGVLSAVSVVTKTQALPLEHRYILPDLKEEITSEIMRESTTAESGPEEREDWPRERTRPSHHAAATDQPQWSRVPLDVWSGSVERNVILAGAGAGKSTLLRFLALDMLSPEPRLAALRRRWPDHLPVWVSFPFWTDRLTKRIGDGSVIDAIEAWFGMRVEDDLALLVRKALVDKRLLLLVDGLDEWPNETVANTALGLLREFVEIRDIPVIVTSRPHGFRLMTGIDSSWSISGLAPFSKSQQVDLASAWFVHLERSATVENDDTKALTSEERGRHRAKAFVAELGRSGDIAQLGSVPLLLTGLIALNIAQVRLPHNRFQAYAQLTNLFLQVHPDERQKAALALEPQFELDSTSRQHSFAALAYAIRSGVEGATPDAISMPAAVSVVANCLIGRIGLDRDDARRQAQSLLTIGEEVIGVLVRKSPREIGFFHRVFLDFLAANHLGSLGYDEQREIVQRHAADPLWRDVILCLLQLITRPAEVDGLIETVEGLSAKPAGAAARNVLLAEAAFGGSGCTPGMANRLADQIFAEIETGPWPTQRRELLDRAIDGLSSAVLKTQVSAKLGEWFPRWHSYGLASVFAEMADWPVDPDPLPVLWRGLHDEMPENRRAAAAALARRSSGDGDLKRQLERMVRAPASIGAAAAGVEALWRGWPDTQSTMEVINAARHSAAPLLEIVGIFGAVTLQHHTDDDFARLLEYIKDPDYRLIELLIEALIGGWKNDPRLKKEVLDRFGLGQVGSTFDVTLPVAIQGFPRDEEIAVKIADYIDRADLFFTGVRHPWHELTESFHDDTHVVQALERWVERKEKYREYEIAHAAKVAPTPTFKKALLECISEPTGLAFWPARALIDIWGPDDAEVRGAISAFADRPVERRQYVADLLPLVLSDKQRCRGLVLDVIDSPENIRIDFALAGLRRLGVDSTDQEAVELALSRDYIGERFLGENEASELIETFPNDARVIEIAKNHLRRYNGVLGTIARVYREDTEMRRSILAVAAPLQTNLRVAITERLGDRATFDDTSLGLLHDGKSEDEVEVVFRSVLGVAHARKTRFDVSTAYIGELREELRSIGPRMDARRPAALGALTFLERLDVFAMTKDLSGDKPVDFSIGWRHSAGSTFTFRFLAENWGNLVEAVGADQEMLDRLRFSHRDFLEEFGPHLGTNDRIKAFAFGLIDAESENGLPASTLRFVARERPGSGYLRQICERSLSHVASSSWSPWSSMTSRLTAAELLGRYFGGDDTLLQQLTERLGRRLDDEGAIAALCEGWPASEELKVVADRLKAESVPLSTPVTLKLVSTISSPIQVASIMSDVADRFSGDLWEAPSYWIPNLVRRLQADDEVFNLLSGRMAKNPTSGEKASLPRLLTRARGLSDDLRCWCNDEITRSERDNAIAEVGMDLVAGEHRIVCQSLMDVVTATDFSG